MVAAGEPRLQRVVLIGAGRMGSAMARGWLGDPSSAGIGSLSVVEPLPGQDLETAGRAGVIRLNPEPATADILVLAIKPQGFGAAARELRAWAGPETLIISIMAGVTIASIQQALGCEKVARAMPNTPGAIGMGATAFSLSAACSDADAAATVALLEPLGLVAGPLDEGLMNAVTAVSGSGPAYVFLLVEALAAAGRAAGLDEAIAESLARETVIGAGALLSESAERPSELRQQVTSPGGTTAAALNVLNAPGGVPDLIGRAVQAAVKRGEELARQTGQDG